MLESQKLTDKILKQARKDRIGWNHAPFNVETFWEEPHAELSTYAKGSPDFVSVEGCTEYLASWYETLYQAEVLEKGTYNASSFAHAAHYGYWYIVCNEPLANRDRGGLVLENDAACCWSMQVIAGWPKRATVVGDILLKGLDTPMLEGSSTVFPHFWFIMHLYTLWKGLPPINTEVYSYPSGPKMAVYNAVLKDWQTRDVQQVVAWCTDMAEHHIRNVLEPDGDSVYEFSRARARLFPYEIFAYLRLREWLKLPNPKQADLKHPLFTQPLGLYVPPLPGEMPSTPVLDAALQRYKREYPDLRMP
jgi:hypothetical protein